MQHPARITNPPLCLCLSSLFYLIISPSVSLPSPHLYLHLSHSSVYTCLFLARPPPAPQLQFEPRRIRLLKMSSVERRLCCKQREDEGSSCEVGVEERIHVVIAVLEAVFCFYFEILSASMLPTWVSGWWCTTDISVFCECVLSCPIMWWRWSSTHLSSTILVSALQRPLISISLPVNHPVICHSPV